MIMNLTTSEVAELMSQVTGLEFLLGDVSLLILPSLQLLGGGPPTLESQFLVVDLTGGW